ncbi:MAG: P-loop NTPase [Actinomycetia bacterium]|nr:P-loop NTPase [Actinomycetes bacterium]MCP5034631.1 P-loop NTPase [Actinomycetes bacterium]
MGDLQTTTINATDVSDDAARTAQVIANTNCDLVVLGSELELELALAAATELTASFPEMDLVLMAEMTHTVLASAMGAGVRQVLSPDTTGPELNEALVRLSGVVALRRTRLAVTAEEEPEQDSGRLITVMAAKGGVGKSTLAVNLAAELARDAHDEVVLVDLNLMAGEIDLLLGIEPKATIASVASEGSAVEAAVIKLSLTRHPSGILILPAPDSLIDADGIDPDLILEVLNKLKASFRYVVVDTAPGAGAALAAAVEAADDLLAVATPDLGGLRSLRRNLDGLDTLGLIQARRHLVLNRSDYRTGLTSQTIENTVELPIAVSIPDTREIPMAANQGMIFVRTQTKTEAARSFRTLATKLEPGEREQSSSPGQARRMTAVA